MRSSSLDDISSKDGRVLASEIQDFQMAVQQAALDGEESIEICEKVFAYYNKNPKSPYFTYGDPGIKVFKLGTREEIEKHEEREI